MNRDEFILYEKFIRDYFTTYSNRDLKLTSLFHEDFMGLAGISEKIYNRETWIEAIAQDYKEMPEPFEIKITNFEIQKMKDGNVLITVISLWFISLFENTPEFDKMRTVFILTPVDNSLKIRHLSNSVSLLPLNNDIYPTELLKFLKIYKETTLGNIQNE